MQYLLAATLFFGILTLWVPGYWAVAVFEVSMFRLAVGAILRWRRTSPPFAYPLVPLLFAVFWGMLQLWTGRTVPLLRPESRWGAGLRSWQSSSWA